MRYTVYNNKTDAPVIVDGTPAECEAAMGICPGSFHCVRSRCKKGINRKWSIYSEQELEADDDDL
jgi:hypothetical protein